MRDEPPVDDVEPIALHVNDKQLHQSKLIEKLQLQISNITDQNKSLRKENVTIENLTKQVDKLKIKTKNDALIHEKELDELETEHDEEIDNLKEQITEIRSSYENDIDGLLEEMTGLKNINDDNAAEYERKCDEIKAKNTKDMKRVVTLHKNKFNEMKTELNEDIVRQSLANKKEYVKMKTELEDQIGNLTVLHEKEHKKMKSDLEHKIEHYKTQIKNIKDQASTMEDELNLSREKTEAAVKECNAHKKQWMLCRQRLYISCTVTVACVASIVLFKRRG